MAIRDFIAKIDDLDIHQGLFVTNTDFSSDALGWAKNGTTKPIEMWNGDMLQEKLMQVTLGRTKNKTISVENCLALRGIFEDYTILALQNHEKVKIKYASLDFCPFYVVSFNLYDRIKTPDKHIRTVSNSGKYFVEGLTGLVLASQDEHGTSSYTDNDEGKEMIQELIELDSIIVEIAETPEYDIKKHESSTSKKEAEFTVKNKISDDNKANISYEVKISRGEYEDRAYHYKPPIKAITTQSKILYVPIWNIEFESKEYIYKKTILPASSIITKDEITICKHLLRKKSTFAVCDICGVAKCKDDITIIDSSYYCKDHIQKETENKNDNKSLFSKFKFGK